MNVYVVEFVNIDGGSGGGVILVYYNIFCDWIVIMCIYIDEDDVILSYEIGYFFLLFYIFNGWECGGYNEEGIFVFIIGFCIGIGGNILIERVNGINCENFGDYICDILVDYNNGIGWLGCNFIL